MRSFFLSLCAIFFINGCVSSQEPQPNNSIKAQTLIKENRSEAKRAQEEYIALQEKRRKEAML